MQRRLRLLLACVFSLAVLVASSTPALAETLPAWVQNHRPTTLWSGADNRAISFGAVPAWSGFQVLGAQGTRMYVRYLGNGVDRDGGVAWVDRIDVGPTNRPMMWLSPRDDAVLWSGPGDDAIDFGFAPADSLMVRLGPAANGRAQAYFLGAGPEHPAGLVWTDLASVRPALAPPDNSPLWQVWGAWDALVAAAARPLSAAPAPRPLLAAPAPRPPSAVLTRPTSSLVTAADQQRFIGQVAGVARRMRAEVGLPPSLVVAMAINETGWGRSALSLQAFNFFGIKAHRGAGPAGVVEFDTWEVVNGQNITIRAAFRAYHTMEESVRDLGTFLRTNERYAPVWQQANDPQAAARTLLQAGYATDPAWADKLISLIDRYNLKQYDAL